MPAKTNHPVFVQPENLNCRVWRYVDFTKFVALLNSESLFFCRADLFKDPYEGCYTELNNEIKHLFLKNIDILNHERIKEVTLKLSKWIRQWTYINCWHANEYESAAMWGLYSNSKESIAIETSYEKLKNVLPERTFLGLVNYIDYKNDYIPEGNTFNPFVHKRQSFMHENEVRAIIQELPPKGEEKEVFEINNELNGISIKIDLNELIEVIHISPVAENWFEELVVDISQKHGLNSKIIKSDLYNDPIH